MNDISKLEEFIGKSVEFWTPSDINNLLDKFSDILTNKILLNILNNTENMEVKKTIKAAMLNLSIDLTNKKMKEYLKKESKNYEEFLNSKSSIEKAIFWVNVLLYDPEFLFDDFKDKIKNDFDEFKNTVIEYSEYNFLELTSKLLDILFFFTNIYYYKSSIELMETCRDDAVNKILERLNYETVSLYPFLDAKNLGKLPRITPEQLGFLDLTKQG